MDKVIEIDNLLDYLYQQGGVVNAAGVLVLPSSLGNGFIKLIKPSPHIRLMLQQYELHHNLMVKRKPNSEPINTVLFSFRNVLADQRSDYPKTLVKTWSSVQISSSDVSLDIAVAAHVPTSNILIQVDRSFLVQLLQTDSQERLAALVTRPQQSYLYEELVSPRIQRIATEIFELDSRDPLLNFYYTIKAEELIYVLLSGLALRIAIPHYPLNRADIEAIYRIRDELVSNLNAAPHLTHLAAQANMSVSKLGKLFRQIFGDSLYNYFQKVRMQQAAYWLSEEHQSVSEVGYRLGFTNLSHFSRLFKKHTGMKPKQYASS